MVLDLTLVILQIIQRCVGQHELPPRLLKWPEVTAFQRLSDPLEVTMAFRHDQNVCRGQRTGGGTTTIARRLMTGAWADDGQGQGFGWLQADVW
jgi:hypothetical protein